MRVACMQNLYEIISTKLILVNCSIYHQHSNKSGKHKIKWSTLLLAMMNHSNSTQCWSINITTKLKIHIRFVK